METVITKQRGIVIIENMIAILVFSMGILGIVGLLTASIKNTAGAKYRNDASLLANQVIAQMWLGNKTNASLIANFASPSGANFVAWQTAVAGSLPGADATTNSPTIAIDANNVATVTLRWQSPGEPAAHNYVAIARINP